MEVALYARVSPPNEFDSDELSRHSRIAKVPLLSARPIVDAILGVPHQSSTEQRAEK